MRPKTICPHCGLNIYKKDVEIIEETAKRIVEKEFGNEE